MNNINDILIIISKNLLVGSVASEITIKKHMVVCSGETKIARDWWLISCIIPVPVLHSINFIMTQLTANHRSNKQNHLKTTNENFGSCPNLLHSYVRLSSYNRCKKTTILAYSLIFKNNETYSFSKECILYIILSLMHFWIGKNIL